MRDDSKRDEKKDNVIPFPTPEGHGWLHKIQSMDIKKFTASATLASVLFVVPLFNGVYVSVTQDQAEVIEHKRGIASFGVVNMPTPEPVSEEFLRKLANETWTSLQAIGKKPEHIEKFQFETLEGNYNISSDNEKISRVQLRESHITPKQIEDSDTFLRKNKDLWSVQFQETEKLGDFVMGSKRSEIYSLKGKNNEVIGKATVLTDISGGMISLTISKQ